MPVVRQVLPEQHDLARLEALNPITHETCAATGNEEGQLQRLMVVPVSALAIDAHEILRRRHPKNLAQISLPFQEPKGRANGQLYEFPDSIHRRRASAKP